MEKKYTATKEFEMRYTDVDFRDEVKPSSYLACFLEVACDSADALGFGYDDIGPKGYGFLVSNFYFEIDRPITLREKVTFETWPLKPGRALFFREYRALVDGEVRVRATSRWCLFHLKEQKILPSSTLDSSDYPFYRTDKAVENVSWKISPLKEGEPCFSVNIGISEYDHYHHVNNTKYADYIFSCFREEEWTQKALKSFQISFIRQCREGERIDFYRREEEGAVLISGFVKEECAVSARLTFA